MSEDENKIEMTEGEAIELLKEYVAYTKQARSPYETDKATEMLLDLYQQEKEKNKVIAETLMEWINGERIYFNHISRDTIKQKIKELEKQAENVRGLQGLRYSESGYIQSKINVLKELIKEN